MTLISNFVPQDYQIIGTCEDALITQNSQYIFAAVRSYGLILIDVTNIYTPQIKNRFITLGAESIIFTQNENFLILSNGFKGIKIFDISDINQIQILGEVKIDGQCLHIRSIFNDNFILVTLQEKGQLALVDITQIGQPLLIQKYQYLSEDIAYDVCLNDDQSIAYLMGRTGNLIIPLKSKIILQTEIFQTQVGSDGKIYVQTLHMDDILLVGMDVLFLITPLFSDHKLFIKSCYYYENYNKDNLPSWISFKQAAQELQLKITKESLNTNINGVLGRTNHQIILLVLQEIQDLDFVSQENNINQKLSAYIKKLCQSQGIIDNVGFITEYFNPYTQFSLQGFNGTDAQQQYINQILKMKVINYPIYFTTDSSLVLNVSDSTNIILSQSSSLQMYISVDPNFARFVDIKYKGALISLSQDSSTIMLQGETCQVNQLVAQGFYIQNFFRTQDINVTISANDQINYQFEETYSFQEVSFLKILENIQVSKTCNLQCEFNQQYSDGAIPVNEYFKFQISDSIFINLSQQKTQYNVNLLIDDQVLQLSKKYWLIFDKTTNSLSGQPGLEQVGQSITIQVNATDSYSFIVDSFTFTVKKDNSSLFLKIFLVILVPIVALLILLQFKSSFYNLFFTQNFCYSTETIEIGKEYTKQIILRDEMFRVAKIIWEQYKKKIEIEILKQELQKLKSIKDESNESKSLSTNKINMIQVENINPKSLLKRNQFDQSSLQPNQENLGVTEDPALKESQQERYKKKHNKEDQEQNFRYFVENGEIDYNFILKQMSIFFDQINNNQPDLSLGQRVNSEDIINTSTKISKILQGFFVKYCISLDQDLQLIFEKIKAMAVSNFNNLDWYKAYTNIASDLDDVSECSIPVITVNEFVFSKTIQIIQHIFPFKIQNLLIIIKESLISTAYGFEEKRKRRWKQRSFGETIYKEKTKIQSIQILQKVRNRSFQQKWGSYRCFRDIGFKQCPQTQNYGLPQWMNALEIINGSIIIGGQPMASDVGQYLIRIFDKNSYIIREFKIFVIKKQIFTQHDHINNATSSKSNHYKQLHQNIPQLSIKYNSRLPITSNVFLNPSISSAHGNLIARDNQEEQME
ncbi:transmembrane protein, putative (macronuclear) [Tetrahymena thermophila SB210]|uniref:Transmembrane protein, putative n=1 Tax=Tetrahymena thermophila (strain SB210) TaxID=312017 RepID=Q245T0_TETTS|nr:transmembrane protein, putative [Tetrahymena thermophila SB210]EAS03553.2 transmembrane protein, putative [Tetrahymena thermophila SB210]|eukprot:XP_001023798.2 transmembrane protein, putative [Tetrahymena thermophila SB210]